VDLSDGLSRPLEKLTNRIFFLTIFECLYYFASKTILEKGGINGVGIKINSGQPGAVESCQGNSTPARAYYADTG
jgi:hypothetical protein